MSEIKEYIILLSLLIVPAGLSLFEKYFSKWHNETDPDKRNKLSGVWHAVKYWVITIASINIFWAHGLTDWLQYLPLMMFLFWVVFDLWWNYFHRKLIGSKWPLYPGNGKGGFIEASVFWLSKKVNISFSLTMILMKLLLLAFSIWLIFKF